MPSKLRYVLFAPGDVFRGPQAVAMLCKMVQRNIYKLELPEGWTEYRTKAKLEFLSQFLPSGYRFVVVREPKWTRKNRSTYIKLYTGKNKTKKISFHATIQQLGAVDGLGLGNNVEAPGGGLHE